MKMKYKITTGKRPQLVKENPTAPVPAHVKKERKKKDA